MDQPIRELITECMGTEGERKGLTMLMLLLEPPREVTKYFDKETLNEGQIIAKEEVKKLGGICRISILVKQLIISLIRHKIATELQKRMLGRRFRLKTNIKGGTHRDEKSSRLHHRRRGKPKY